MNSDQLLHVMPHAKDRVGVFLQPLNDAMEEFYINYPERIAAFIAQVAWESAELQFTKELGTGDKYEFRYDLGNTMPGDGRWYKGRGLIEITGKFNYEKCGVALGVDLLNHPQLLEQPVLACRSAAWFWHEHGLNELADKGLFEQVTRRINGGLSAEAQRLVYWERAKEVLK